MKTEISVEQAPAAISKPSWSTVVWPGEKQRAAKLEAMLRQNCETSVINSEDSMRNLHPHWCHIGSDGYFTDQWNAALERFIGDVLLHVQADVWPHDVGPMLAECVRYMRDHDVGVYAPDIVNTPTFTGGNRLFSCMTAFTKFRILIVRVGL